MQSDGLNSALSPVVYGDTALSTNTIIQQHKGISTLFKIYNIIFIFCVLPIYKSVNKYTVFQPVGKLCQTVQHVLYTTAAVPAAGSR